MDTTTSGKETLDRLRNIVNSINDPTDNSGGRQETRKVSLKELETELDTIQNALFVLSDRLEQTQHKDDFKDAKSELEYQQRQLSVWEEKVNPL